MFQETFIFEDVQKFSYGGIARGGGYIFLYFFSRGVSHSVNNIHYLSFPFTEIVVELPAHSFLLCEFFRMGKHYQCINVLPSILCEFFRFSFLWKLFTLSNVFRKQGPLSLFLKGEMITVDITPVCVNMLQEYLIIYTSTMPQNGHSHRIFQPRV